jgi:hypothetical protein
LTSSHTIEQHTLFSSDIFLESAASICSPFTSLAHWFVLLHTLVVFRPQAQSIKLHPSASSCFWPAEYEYEYEYSLSAILQSIDHHTCSWSVTLCLLRRIRFCQSIRDNLFLRESIVLATKRPRFGPNGCALPPF